MDVGLNYKENKFAADEVVPGDHEVLTARDRDRCGCRRPETGRLADLGDHQSGP